MNVEHEKPLASGRGAVNDVVKMPEPAERPALPAARSTMDMVQEAVMRGAPMELIEKLLALHERFESTQARKAFDQAIASAKGEIPVILKKRKGHSGKYEDIGDIADIVAPILSKHGLSYRYRASQNEKQVIVTCIVSHRDGYSEESELASPPDTSGNKTPIHAMASALTYLQRYTLKLALGIAASKDDDGQAAGGAAPDGPISAAQINQLVKLAEDVGFDEKDQQRFFNYMKVKDLSELLTSQFESAKKLIEGKRKKAVSK